MAMGVEKLQQPSVEGSEFSDFLIHINGRDRGHNNLLQLGEIVTPQTPIVYWSMEFYDKEENDIKGGGGLGVLAADTRRVAEQLGIPLVVVTPFYREESHQEIVDFAQVERQEEPEPGDLYTMLGRTAISTESDVYVPLEIFGRELGSTRIITITEKNFGELYPGGNSDDHRLYQEVALGFAGYKALKKEGLEPRFMQLNEAPTVFAAVARLDDLCEQGVAFDQALNETKKQMLYTNHTLVQAVEGEFELGQFVRMVMPNIRNEEVRDWIYGMFSDEGLLKLSSLAVELAENKSGVSELHARVSDFRDQNGDKVKFEAVTNGISSKWTVPEILRYYRDLGILDRFGMPSEDYAERLDGLDIDMMRELKAEGRRQMNEILANRKDQYGNPIHIPEDALVFDFKRRFVSYKRANMVFDDPNRLADILEDQNAHFIFTGKPHPNDGPMKEELTRLLNVIDQHPVLKDRVHYIVDYDEEVGKAMSIGADCAVNVPEVGKEACGTSWMKDMSNFKLLISTPDGGVADVEPIACLEVSENESEPIFGLLNEAAVILGEDERYKDGPLQSHLGEIVKEVRYRNEVDTLYKNMTKATEIIRDDEQYKAMVVAQLKEYMPVISGSRMMASYLKLFTRFLSSKRTLTLVEQAA